MRDTDGCAFTPAERSTKSCRRNSSCFFWRESPNINENCCLLFIVLIHSIPVCLVGCDSAWKSGQCPLAHLVKTWSDCKVATLIIVSIMSKVYHQNEVFWTFYLSKKSRNKYKIHKTAVLFFHIDGNWKCFLSEGSYEDWRNGYERYSI